MSANKRALGNSGWVLIIPEFERVKANGIQAKLWQIYTNWKLLTILLCSQLTMADRSAFFYGKNWSSNYLSQAC